MTVDLFDKFNPVLEQCEQLPKDAHNPFSVCMDEVLSQTEAVIDGRRTILAGTNNYLGLTHNPEGIAAARDALEAMGTGTTGSRVLNGTFAGHRKLESALAEFYGTKHAMVFSTGYQANLGTISTLAGPQDFILIDADCHASIYDACRLGAATVVRFRHNDPADLDKRLRRLGKEKAAGKLVVVEGIYSMLGDQAPLAELAEVTHKHGASLLVDEAHSLGVLGATGRGLAQETGVEGKVDFIVGTFSKSVGTIGGFCVSNHPKFDVLRLVCRPYMFTASLPPSVVASAISALGQIPDPSLRSAVWGNAKRLAQGLTEAGFELGAGNSPIVAVVIKTQEIAVRFWDLMLRSGVYVNLALPPATPQGLNLLRCSLCAAHTAEQIDTMIKVFVNVGHELGVLGTAEPSKISAGVISGTPPSDAVAKTTANPSRRGVAAATG
ncbi:MAG: aminotransferase class I/II-fold pyridoxal phosphate-dependent enzyme [Sphingomonadales bacterium]